MDPENSEKGGLDPCPLAGYIETFYCSANSIKILQINLKEKKAPFSPTLNPPLLLLYNNVTAPLFDTEKKLIGAWIRVR